MQHFNIKPMCVPLEQIEARYRRDAFWFKVVIVILVYWNLQAIFAVLWAAERAFQLAELDLI